MNNECKICGVNVPEIVDHDVPEEIREAIKSTWCTNRKSTSNFKCKFRSWLRDKHKRCVALLKLVWEYLQYKMEEDDNIMDEELREMIKSLNNDNNKDMKLIAEISIGADGTIIYAGGVTADKEPLNEATSMQVDVLTETHHAMKEAVDRVNASLMERGLTEKLATPNRDEYGNPRIPGYGIRIIN